MRLAWASASFLSLLYDLKSQKRDLGPILTMPNLHRMLQLFVQTVPLYGHVLNESKLVPASYHQVLKAGLKKKS